MRYGLVGCSHRTAPLERREALAFAPGDVPDLLRQLAASENISEVMMINTCNRVELAIASPRPEQGVEEIHSFICSRKGLPAEHVGELFYAYYDEDAVTHIFRVAASLDSMVIGEAQILGQVKDAFEMAVNAGTVGPRLHRCLQQAFGVAKRVRSETGIARNAASISSVAVELAGRIFDDLATVAVCVVGGGEMAELALRHLLSMGATRIHVLNRTPERAEQLARELQAQAIPFAELPAQLAWADIVITATSGEQPLITKQLLQRAMRQRKQRSIFIVDIAVPCNVDVAARKLPNVYHFDVDDLQEVVAENVRARRAEGKIAERMIGDEVTHFFARQRGDGAGTLIGQMREKLLRLADEESHREARRLRLTKQQEEGVVLMARSIVNKMLHRPTVELKRAGSSETYSLEQAMRQLFDIETQPAQANESSLAESSPEKETALPVVQGTGSSVKLP